MNILPYLFAASVAACADSSSPTLAPTGTTDPASPAAGDGVVESGRVIRASLPDDLFPAHAPGATGVTSTLAFSVPRSKLRTDIPLTAKADLRRPSQDLELLAPNPYRCRPELSFEINESELAVRLVGEGGHDASCTELVDTVAREGLSVELRAVEWSDAEAPETLRIHFRPRPQN